MAGMATTGITATKISDGGTRYRARYRDATGKQHERRFRRKVDAQGWLDEQTAALVTQTWTAPVRGKITVGEWSARWIDAQGQLKPSTRYRYESLLRTQVLPPWGGVKLADVQHAEVAAWVARMSASGLAPSTVRQAHRVLALVLTLAVRDGRIPRNPADGVPLPRVTRDEPRFLTRGDVGRLAEHAGEYGDAVWLLALTGLRFGELAGLRVRDVDSARRRLTVAQSASEIGGRVEVGTPKTHQRRTVPLPGSLVEPLARRCEDRGGDDPLIAAPGGGLLRLNNWRRRCFDPAVAAAGLDGITPHDLRHTAASLAISSGASVKAVQRLLGHASAAMTLDVYAGLFGDDLDALAERMDAAHDAHREGAGSSEGTVRARGAVVELAERRAGR